MERATTTGLFATEDILFIDALQESVSSEELLRESTKYATMTFLAITCQRRQLADMVDSWHTSHPSTRLAESGRTITLFTSHRSRKMIEQEEELWNQDLRTVRKAMWTSHLAINKEQGKPQRAALLAALDELMRDWSSRGFRDGEHYGPNCQEDHHPWPQEQVDEDDEGDAGDEGDTYLKAT